MTEERLSLGIGLFGTALMGTYALARYLAWHARPKKPKSDVRARLTAQRANYGGKWSTLDSGRGK